MATATTTVTLNPAFLQEIKEDHQELWQLLERLRQDCSEAGMPGFSRRGLFEMLGRLRDRLAMHFALEEAFGYFEDAALVAPQLCQKAETLRSQHGKLYLTISMIADEADGLLHHETPMKAARRIASQFDEFYRALRRHEDEENRLISEMFNDDIGVGD